MISAKRSSADALDEPALPQRLGPVELLGGDPRGELEQVALGAGRGQRRVTDVVLEVEVRVIDPQRSPGVERRRRQLLPVAGNQVQAPADVVQQSANAGGGPSKISTAPMCMCDAGPS